LLPILYGLWSARREGDTLLLVEGEINALSVWQCAPALTCLSFGSEAGARPGVLRAAAERYRRVFVWADDPARSLAIRASLGRQAMPLQSPTRDAMKLDANAMLQAGVLREFLREVRASPG
jgi:hypothetical protein